MSRNSFLASLVVAILVVLAMPLRASAIDYDQATLTSVLGIDRIDADQGVLPIVEFDILTAEYALHDLSIAGGFISIQKTSRVYHAVADRNYVLHGRANHPASSPASSPG